MDATTAACVTGLVFCVYVVLGLSEMSAKRQRWTTRAAWSLLLEAAMVAFLAPTALPLLGYAILVVLFGTMEAWYTVCSIAFGLLDLALDYFISSY